MKVICIVNSELNLLNNLTLLKFKFIAVVNYFFCGVTDIYRHYLSVTERHFK